MDDIIVGLKPGHRGKEVRTFQSRLKKVVPGSWFKGRWKGLVVDGDFGKHTEDCTAILQMKMLDIDKMVDIPEDVRGSWNLDDFKVTGEVCEMTKWVLEHSHKFIEHYDLTEAVESLTANDEYNNKFIEAYMKLISEQIGVKEEGANNRGKKIDEYIEYGSWETIRKEVAPAWCQLVLAYCLRVMFEGFGFKEWKWLKQGIAYTPYNVEKGRQLGMTYKVKSKDEIGMLDWLYIHFNRLGRVGHVVQVVGFDPEDPDYIICFEGNTNVSGSRSGDQAMYRGRHWKSFKYGVRILELFGDLSKFKRKEKTEEEKHYDSLSIEDIKGQLEELKKQYSLEVSYQHNTGKKKLFKLLKEKIKEAYAIDEKRKAEAENQNDKV